MANTEYKLTRPGDDHEFTMLLDEDDRQRYEDAGWKPTATKRKNPTTPRDLAARQPRTRRTAAKADDTTDADESNADDADVEVVE
ncbi:hypothetical protein ACTND8_06240 [Atopobiaceae bacterium HCP3S3_F7]|jgi:hypothetical protein|uniref:hypothetical protein n=1 Tax=Bacillati TaxID=1783272 RepID=UPI003F8A6FCB